MNNALLRFFILATALVACTPEIAPEEPQEKVDNPPPMTDSNPWLSKRDDLASHLRKDSYLKVIQIDGDTLLVQIWMRNSFRAGSASPSPDLLKLLDYIATALREAGNKINIEITGYTDARKTSSFRKNLSAKRAEAACQRFVAQGIDKVLITTEGKGEANPIVPNTTSEGREYNRRIELRIKPASDKLPQKFCI